MGKRYGRPNSGKIKVYLNDRSQRCNGPMTEAFLKKCGFKDPAYDPLTSEKPPPGYEGKNVKRLPDGRWILLDDD